MEDLNQIGTHLIKWLSSSSIEAVVLVCLIMLIHLTAGRKLPGRWRYAIWILLMIRLVTPWAPASSVSVYNLLSRDNWSSVSVRYDRTEPLVDHRDNKGFSGSNPIEPVAVPATVPVDESVALGRTVSVPWSLVCMVIWLTGAIVVFTSSVFATIRLSVIVRQKRLVTDSKVLDLLEDCKEQMQLCPVLGLVESDCLRGPAIFGWIRPRIILPAGLIKTLSKEQLRHIFLHELAHIKRHDALWGWIMALLQAIHWFNPFVWLAFYRMRSDREMACDQLVLDHIAESDVKSYGNTIVVLLQEFSKREFLPALAGLAEHKTQTQRRISMITHYKKETHTVTLFAVMLLCCTAWVTLTNAAPNDLSTRPVSGLTPAMGEYQFIVTAQTPSLKGTAKGLCNVTITPDLLKLLAKQTSSSYIPAIPMGGISMLHLQNPRILLKLPIRAGDQWDDTWKGYESYTKVTLASNPLALQCGTFSDCLLIETTIVQADDPNPNHNTFKIKSTCGTRRLWLAKGVGLVQMEYEHSDETTTLMRLTDYSLDTHMDSYFPTIHGARYSYSFKNDAFKDSVNETWQFIDISKDRRRSLVEVPAVPTVNRPDNIVFEPWIISETVSPGESFKTAVTIRSLKNNTVRAKTSVVALAKHKYSGRWEVLKEDMSNSPKTDLEIGPSCVQWISLDKNLSDNIEVEANQTTSLEVTIEVPSEAKGNYWAGLKTTLSPADSNNGITVRYDFIVPVLLEVQ